MVCRIVTALLQMPGWDGCLAKWELHGAASRVSHSKTSSWALWSSKGLWRWRRKEESLVSWKGTTAFCCWARGRIWVLLGESFHLNCNGVCLSFTGTYSAPCRNYRRVKSYQCWSSSACPHAAKLMHGYFKCKQSLCFGCVLLHWWLTHSYCHAAGAPCPFQTHCGSPGDWNQQV